MKVITLIHICKDIAINKIYLIKKEKFKKYLILGDMLELGSKSEKIP